MYYLTTNHKVLELKLVITKGISNIDLKSINPKITLRNLEIHLIELPLMTIV